MEIHLAGVREIASSIIHILEHYRNQWISGASLRRKKLHEKANLTAESDLDINTWFQKSSPELKSSFFCQTFTFHCWPLWSVKHNTSLLYCCRCKLWLNLSRRHCRNIFRSSIKLMFVFMKIVYKFACPCVILRLETFLCVGFYGCCCLLSDISFSKITWGL